MGKRGGAGRNGWEPGGPGRGTRAGESPTDLLDSLPLGIQENDCEGTITYSNPAHHRILGYGPGELIGKKIWEFLPSTEEAESLKTFLADLVRATPAATPFTALNRRKNGSLVQVRVDWGYLRSPCGTVRGFGSTIAELSGPSRPDPDALEDFGGSLILAEATRDLPRSSTTQQVLRKAVEGLSCLTDLDSCAVYLLDGEVLHLRATHPPVPPAILKNLSRALLRDHPHIQRALATGSPTLVPDIQSVPLTEAERDIVTRRDLRTLLYVPLVVGRKTVGVFIVGSVGEPISVSDQDVGRVKRLAELSGLTLVNASLYASSQLQASQLNEALIRSIRAEEERRASKGRYQALFEQSPVGILIADQRSHYLDANPRICELLGYSREEMIGLHASDIVAAKELGNIEPALEQITDASGYSRIWTFRRKDGSEFDADVYATLLPDANLLALIRDISQQRRAEAERLRLEAQLQHAQKMESVGRLAGGIAHDFNNMLGVIIGHAELASQKVRLGDPVFDDLGEIRKAAERSAELTRQLLAFARKQTAKPAVLDLNAVISDMLKILRRLIGEDIDLEWVPGAGVGSVKIDPAQVDQILANLCVNSRDAILGAGKVTIRTGVASFTESECVEQPESAPGDFVVLTVSDDGSGIDRETLPNIFEPFFTTKEEGRGTGLGLSMVYGIVKQNGGFVTVASEAGEGTTVRIHLPGHQADPGKSEGRKEPDAPGGGRETILLVEDEEMILELGKEMLESLGYAVLTAGTPGRALALAKDHPGEIDLLLTDVVLPEMNGLELAEEIRDIFPGVEVLYMSGYTADVVTDKGILNEGVLLLEKPFTFRELANRVREALGTDRDA